jgi:hypothetical protein
MYGLIINPFLMKNLIWLCLLVLLANGASLRFAA